MTLLSELISHAQVVLQDTEERAWTEDRTRRAVLAEVAGLAREDVVGDVVWLRAVARQGTYTTADGISPRTVAVQEILYDGTPLLRADERHFEEADRSWTTRSRRPFLWTHNLLDPTQLRVFPTPAESGPDVPVFPPYPLLLPVERNFLAFVSVDLLSEDTQADVDVGLPEGYDEVAVYGAVGHLCEDASDYGDPVKATAFRELAALYRRMLSEDV